MKTEWLSHFKASGKEFLLALRGLIEAGVEFLEERKEESEEEKKE